MITFKSIKPATKFKSSAFRARVLAAAKQVEPKIKKDFEKTVATWDEKPEFKSAIKVGNAAGGSLAKKVTGSAGGVSIEVSTDSDIYRFVDEGTKVRYATMSPDFQAKTKVNKLTSSKGRGKKLFVNKKRPKPGIKARNFTKNIGKKWQPEFRREMQAAVNQAAKESGHGNS